MSDLAVDPTPFLATAGERADGPLIPMVVSLTFPGMDRGAHADLQDSFTRIAFDAVRAAGGRPRLVDSADPARAEHAALLAEADGIVFLGGGDVAGACYGYDGPPPANEYGVDQRADEFCLAAIEDSVARDLPTLAICRGSQLLSVAFGGTLIPDIENWQLHRGQSPLFIDEEVLLEPGSEIARILGRTAVTVRNGHHQAVATVGPELRVSARAHDGIIEGTEHRFASWVVGVQWHPRRSPPRTRRIGRGIFGEVVARARTRAAAR